MANGTFIRFVHNADVYTKTTTVNVAGQRAVVFDLTTTLPCLLQTSATENRVSPYVENIDEYIFYFSHQDSSYIDYNNRLTNIQDRTGAVIEAGTLEITSIKKQPGFSGKIHHIIVKARLVVEND